MPRNPDIHKVLVIGSGPIVIGQAAEFDYAGTQACKALHEEGCEVVLINSNPATIMTDTEMADRVYIEPLTPEFVSYVLERERPDGLLATLGGQTGLNLATQVAATGILDRLGVKMLGTSLEAIRYAEDREAFRSLMQSIGEPVPESWIAESEEQLRELAGQVCYPVIIRPAYTLGGTGGGIAKNPEELIDVGTKGLEVSMRHQVLVERCLLGWKEVEFEVMRDAADSCITVCCMENFDPMGIHTGDSIVVAPNQTLSDKEYQMLRSASLKIIRALKIEGGCNVQLAVNPNSYEYHVIEVNPRVSRSSALASKATGYPIARVAAKIAMGLHLDEIPNAVTGKTMAAFEPALDYVVVKIPRWPFDKFAFGDRTVGTQMKATGEVMAIDRTFEAALMKAIRSLEIGVHGLRLKGINLWTDMQIEEGLREATDERLFVIAEALRRGMMVSEIQALTGVDRWFLEKLRGLVELEQRLQSLAIPGRKVDLTAHSDLLVTAKRLGLPDRYIADMTGLSEKEVRDARESLDLRPVYKMVDTCAAEFEAETPYFYSSYEYENEGPCLRCTLSSNPGPARRRPRRKRAVVLGSGPIRIGQGIEFDYCSVHSVWALREAGYEAVIINNNPETVSTDFDTSDRLYFEPLTLEDVLNCVREEDPEGVIVQFGGQTAINLARPLHDAGVPILGTSADAIDLAEDRDRFDNLLRELNIPKPPGRAVNSAEAAVEVADEIGYPVLVRPSYVLGGRAMEIVYSRDELLNYMRYAVEVSPAAPILVDKYIFGVEAEVDVISDGVDCLLPGIMEHIERAGVHSGDSMAVYPPYRMSEDTQRQIVEYATRLCRALNVVGLMNIQFVLENGKAYVLEVNPRASRTVPYLSKITGIPMVNVATHLMLGKTLRELGYRDGLYPTPKHYAVKAPVFSFSKLIEVDVVLGPEMKSTGEIMGVAEEFPDAVYKAMVASGVDVPVGGRMILTVADRDKPEALPIAKGFAELNFEIYATRGTAEFLQKHGIPVKPINKIQEGSPHILELVRSGKVDLLVNTASRDRRSERQASTIRRASVEYGVPCLTSLDTARALLHALKHRKHGDRPTCMTIDEYFKQNS
ncbi:MAG: carbamoyl-phosphate synthase large subunit [Armatimonadota bacterium]